MVAKILELNSLNSLSAMMHGKVIHPQFFIIISAIFTRPRFVEIRKFCYHGNVT